MPERLALIAGSGALVPEVVAAALKRGFEIKLWTIGRRGDLQGYQPTRFSLSNPQVAVDAIRAFGATRFTMVGGVSLSDVVREGLASFFSGSKSSQSIGDTSISDLVRRLEDMAGTGLPGIVLALRVEGPVTLVEPRRLRADFLQRTAARLRLDERVRVENVKVERVTGAYDVITARAVASLSELLRISQHLSTGKTVWALPKGRTALTELAEARSAWQGVFHVEQSVTDDDSYIVIGTGVRAKAR